MDELLRSFRIMSIQSSVHARAISSSHMMEEWKTQMCSGDDHDSSTGLKANPSGRSSGSVSLSSANYAKENFGKKLLTRPF